jgi:cytochrome c-type biogenesis protein CcmE
MKKTHLIGILVIAIAIAAIVSTFSDSSTYANFAESKETNKEIHVVGKLQKEKEMVYNPIQDANYFSFYVKDQQGEECKVIYAGTKPQDFEKSEQIVLIGKMKADEFHASKILMKCPSKYNNDKVETKEFKAQAS